MHKFAHFSRHAFIRLMQRTRLRSEEIANILDQGLVIDTGRMPGFNRRHLLFYSLPDDNFFVAIQDELTGTVITILPLEYQSNLAWKITEKDCLRARKILIEAPNDWQHQKKSLSATRFIVSGNYIDDEGYRRAKVIAKLDSIKYNNDMAKLLLDETFFSKLDELACEAGIDPKRIFEISLRLGKNGHPIIIDLRDARDIYYSLDCHSLSDGFEDGSRC